MGYTAFSQQAFSSLELAFMLGLALQLLDIYWN